MKNIFSTFFGKKKSEPITQEVISDVDVIENENDFLSSPMFVGYNDINEQILTYNSLLTFYTVNQSILDVGCGRGDLFVFMKERYEDVFLDSNYYGIDNNPIAIDTGINRYGLSNIHLKDFTNYRTIDKFNWVIASNYFLDVRDNEYDYLYNHVDKMYNLCNYAVAFNIITEQANITYTDDIPPYSVYDPGEVLNHLLNTYRKVIVRADYLLGDSTFYIFKN